MVCLTVALAFDDVRVDAPQSRQLTVLAHDAAGAAALRVGKMTCAWHE
jgi:hypothetical protein